MTTARLPDSLMPLTTSAAVESNPKEVALAVGELPCVIQRGCRTPLVATRDLLGLVVARPVSAAWVLEALDAVPRRPVTPLSG